MATTIPVLLLSDGHSMPGVGLGTWKSKPGEVGTAVKIAIDYGYRNFDCAWIYGNEAEIGEAIRFKVEDGTVKRQDLFITTKLWNNYHRPDLVEINIRDSLQKLQLDYVDLYLMHWPFAFKAADEEGQKDTEGNVCFSDVDYLDTWKAMEQLVDNGLTRSIGVSNFNSEQLGRLLSMEGIKHKPVVNQFEAHPYLNNDKLITFCQDRGITVTAYSPLGCVDHPQAKSDHPRVFDEPVLKEIGKKYGKSAAQVTLRWGIQRGTAVIPKSVTPSRIQENIQISDFQLSAEDMKTVFLLNKKTRFSTCTFLLSKNHKYYPFDIEF